MNQMQESDTLIGAPPEKRESISDKIILPGMAIVSFAFAYFNPDIGPVFFGLGCFLFYISALTESKKFRTLNKWIFILSLIGLCIWAFFCGLEILITSPGLVLVLILFRLYGMRS